VTWSAVGPEWVLGTTANGAVYGYCNVCGAESGATNEDGLYAFADAHSEHTSSPDFVGLGDAVTPSFTALGKLLGLQHCTPCERRRLMLNSLAPRLWRR